MTQKKICSTRKQAYDVLNLIMREGAYSNLALKEALKNTEHNHAARITALVYCTVEHCSYADYLIAHYAKGRIHGSVRIVLQMGIAEMLFMNTPDHVVCSESVELIRSIGKGGLSGYVNGVLRSIARGKNSDGLPELPSESAKKLHVLYGVPEFMAREYIGEYGFDFTDEMLASRVHNFTVRAQYPFTTEQLCTELDRLGIEYRRGKYVKDALVITKSGELNISGSALFNEGKIAIQSESAMLCCLACGADSGMKILDACSAPGGKTACLASLMKNNGHIVAEEFHPHRVKLTEATLKRLGVSIAECICADAAEFNPEFENAFDVVLVDAPCSGMGGGTKPDAYLNRTENNVCELASLQQKILEACCRCVKPGGRLVYSTCTVSKRENADTVQSFLMNHPEFTAVSPFDCVDSNKLRQNEDIRRRSAGGMLQLFPNLDGMDGFFIAAAVKSGAEMRNAKSES